MSVKLEIGTRVELKERTQDLAITRVFSRTAGETWSRGTIAYVAGFEKDREGKEVVMIVKYTPAGGVKHQIDVYAEHIRMTACQPNLKITRYKKSRKTRKEDIDKMKSYVKKEKLSVGGIIGNGKDQVIVPTEDGNTEIVDRKEWENEEIVLTKLEDMIKEDKEVQDKIITEHPLLQDIKTGEKESKEQERAKHLVELIRERKWVLKNNKVTEPTLSRLGQKFKNRNHKKRIITLMNRILNEKVVLNEKTVPKKKIVTNGHHKDALAFAKELFQIMVTEKIYNPEIKINESLVTKLNKKLSAPQVYNDRSEKIRVVTRLKNLVKKEMPNFTIATILGTTVDDIKNRNK